MAFYGSHIFRLPIIAVKRALGLHSPGRNLEVFDDDVFIVSYPRSGNTWARFLLANLVHPEKSPDFRNINELIPDPEALSKRHLAKLPRPRIIKTHQYFHPSYRKIIFVVRDPRDHAVSGYHFLRKMRFYSDDVPIEEHVKRITSDINSQYGSWGENTASWLATRGNDPQFLLVRYEDLLQNTAEQLGRIALFLGVEADSERIHHAIERSSADKMRELERSQALLWSTTKKTRQDIPFVRSAKSGNWRTELPESSVLQIEAAWGDIMQRLGYQLSGEHRTCVT